MSWSNIPGFKGKYKINDEGQVINNKGKSITPHIHNEAVYAKLRKDGKQFTLPINRLVIKSFKNINDEELDKYFIIHIDGDITNNDIHNLKLKKKLDEKNIAVFKNGVNLINDNINTIVEFIINNHLSRTKDERAIKNGIRKVIDKDNTYLGMTFFELGDQIA